MKTGPHLILKLQLTLLMPHKLKDIGFVIHHSQRLLGRQVAAVKKGNVTALPPM